MYQYTVTQWIFLFYFYCFCGWCFESTYVSLKTRKWTNRGFLRGPFLPLYGSGAIMMLVVSMPFQDNIALTYVAGCLGATALEYVTGVVMEALFKVRYWDYSKQKFNFQGHICLFSSLAWGLLTIVMTAVVHKPIENVLLSIPDQVLSILTVLLTAWIFGDFALSFRAALDLRDVLVKLEKARKELGLMQKRLDVIIAVTGEDVEQKIEEYRRELQQTRENFAEARESFVENLAEKKVAFAENIDEKKDDLKELLEELFGELGEAQLPNLQDLKGIVLTKLGGKKSELQKSLSEMLHRRSGVLEGMGKRFRKILQSNPSIRSVEFGEALEELRKEISGKHNEKE